LSGSLGVFRSEKIHQTLVLRRIRYSPPYHPEICQGKELLQFYVVLADASVEHLPDPKLAFDDPNGILHFGPEVGFRRLNQIQKPVLRCLWKHSALAWLHGNFALSLAVLKIVLLLVAIGFRAAVADVASIAVDKAFIHMKPVCCCIHHMHCRDNAAPGIGSH